MVPSPSDEPERLRRLLSVGIDDIDHDTVLIDVAQRALLMFPGADSAAVSIIGDQNVRFPVCAGLTWQAVSRAHSFCSHAILQDDVLVVQDAWRDARFADNPLVCGCPHLRFYAGIAVGHGVGTLCVIGLQPRLVRQRELAALRLLARAADEHLALRGALQHLRQPHRAH